eukprot:scaffold444334_cov19-Prasinocladus_malaysianus.AAC.1
MSDDLRLILLCVCCRRIIGYDVGYESMSATMLPSTSGQRAAISRAYYQHLINTCSRGAVMSWQLTIDTNL